MSSLAIEQGLFKNVNTMLTKAFLIPGEAKSQLEAYYVTCLLPFFHSSYSITAGPLKLKRFYACSLNAALF